MEPARIGIIGAGQIAKKHLDAYEKIDGVEVVAVCDIDEQELQRVAERYAIPHKYTDFRKLLERDDLQAVDVCLHNNMHAAVTVEAFNFGKDVYCEKPVAGSYVDGKTMVEAAESSGRKLHIQIFTLFERETLAAREIIDEGKLGRLYHARSAGYRRRGRPFVDGYGTANFVKREIAAGGALHDMGIYHIAQVLYLLGMPPVERISGKVYQETEMDPGRRKSSGYDVEELGVGFVRFGDGITMDLIEAWAIQLDRFNGSSIVGNKGGLRLKPLGFYSTFCDLDMESTFDLDRMNFRWHKLRENFDAYDSSHHHWIAVQQGRVELLPTARLALDTMLIQEGIYLSDRLGREVTADEIKAQSKSTSKKM